MRGIESFQDKVIELEQYRKFTDAPRGREVIEQPDCAQVINEMEELVSADPSICDFYAGIMRGYRKTRPESVSDERKVIRDRFQEMYDLDLLSDAQLRTQNKKLAEGSLIYDEAKLFFRMFKQQLESGTIPRDRYKKARLKSHKLPEQLIDDSYTDKPALELVADLPQPAPDDEVTEMASEAKAPELGHEYDELFKAYENHPLNAVVPRYKRDFAGFEGKMPKPLRIASLGNSDDDGTEWFAAHMRRFPLLDGLAHERALKEKIEAGIIAHQELKSETSLEPDQRRDLELAAIHGSGAYQTMYECNLKLVYSIANRHKTSSGRALIDIIQDGCIGLRRAIQKYDPAKGFKLSTYATFWIKQSIARNSGVMNDVYLPAHVLVDANAIHRLWDKNDKDGAPRLADDDLVELGYDSKTINAARNFMFTERYSLDKPVGDDGSVTLQDLMGEEQADYERLVNYAESHQAIQDLVDTADLDERSRYVLSIRSGVVIEGIDYSRPLGVSTLPEMSIGEALIKIRFGELHLTLDQISMAFDLTRERIRQIEITARTNMLLHLSLGLLSERLKLNYKEKSDLTAFATYKLVKVGKPQPFQNIISKKIARQTVELLGLLDEDREAAIAATVAALGRSSEVSHKIRAWLQVRFGIVEHPEGVPISGRDAKTYSDLDPSVAKIADATYLAILAGLISKDGIQFESVDSDNDGVDMPETPTG